MSDELTLVERLRSEAEDNWLLRELLTEAADEIELVRRRFVDEYINARVDSIELVEDEYVVHPRVRP